MRALSLLLVCASTAVAAADPEPRFEVIDRDTAVEIIARDIHATATTIRPVRERLEVPIAATDSIPKLWPTGDKMIRVVELDGHSRPVLSVKLAFERPEVRELAKVAQVTQVGDDLHMIVPRTVPAPGQAVTLPEPTLPPELLEKAAAIAPVPTIERPAASPAATSTPAPARPAEPAQTAAPTDPPKPARTTAAGKPEPHDNTAILLVLALAALGSGLWLKRKNRKPSEAASSIEIVAQKALGAKAKIVWVRAGEREMLVAVSPQGVRTLGQWKRDGREAAHGRMPLPEAVTHSAPADTASSPAVAGILKLRARTSTNTDEMLAGDGEADSAWAKEILAATTGMRR